MYVNTFSNADETVCDAQDPGPYLKGQGYSGELNIKQYKCLARAITSTSIKGLYNTLAHLFTMMREWIARRPRSIVRRS